VTLLACIAASEVATLYSLATATPHGWSFAIACGGMAAAFVSIANVALFGSPPELERDTVHWVQVADEILRRRGARDAAPEDTEGDGKVDS
jgi:hypothetical protein